MGGGASSVKETAAEKEAAAVAKEQWDLYKNDLQQYEDIFMEKVDDLNSEGEFDKLAGTAALGTAQSFGESRAGLADSMAASGVDPTSGRYQEAMEGLATDQALSQTDTTNRAQSSQQDKHVAGLKDVVSIGAGQKAESLAAMGVCGNNVKTINTSMLAMAAVFKYLPATKVSIYSAVLQSVFIKPVDYTLVKLKRTFILDLGLQGLLGSKQPTVTCSNLAIQGVFRYASPRIETIIMNLKYPIMV